MGTSQDENRLHALSQRPLAARDESGGVRILEDQPGREGTHDRREPHRVRRPGQHEAERQARRDQRSSTAQAGTEAEDRGRQPCSGHQGDREEGDGLGDEERHAPRVHAANASPVDRAADDSQNDEAKDVVEHGGAQDGVGLRLVRSAGVLENPGADSDARRSDRGGHEQLHEGTRAGGHEPAGDPPEQQRADGPENGDPHGRDADANDVTHRRIESDLEQEYQDPEARQHVDAGVGPELMEERERQAAEQDPGDQLAEDRRLLGARRKVASDFRRDEDNRDGQAEPGDGIRRRPHGRSMRRKPCRQAQIGGHACGSQPCVARKHPRKLER